MFSKKDSYYNIVVAAFNNLPKNWFATGAKVDKYEIKASTLYVHWNGDQFLLLSQ